MAETVHAVEGNMGMPIRKGMHTLSGSESTACNKSGSVNVGGPNNSIRMVVLINKLEKRGD